MDTGRINIVMGDTDVCPWDVGVHASRSTFIASNSALGAAQQVREQILSAAADILQAPRESLDLSGGLVVCADDPEKSTKLDKVLRRAHFAAAGNTMFMAAHFYEPDTDLMAGDFKGNYSMTYTWGCHGVEIRTPPAPTGPRASGSPVWCRPPRPSPTPSMMRWASASRSYP